MTLTRRQSLLMLAALAGLAASPLVAAPTNTLTLGVVPYLSARRLAELYEPLRAWFATTLARPCALESAPNYRAHFARTAAGAYDFIATSPYFGRIAQLRHGFVGLARPSTELEPLIVVLPTSPIATLADLKGKRIATSDAWANLSLAARRLFREQGWELGRDVALVPTGSHANSFAHMAQGLADAAVVSVTALKQLDYGPERYRIVHRLPPSPPLLYLAHERLGSATINRLREQLIHFSERDPAGQQLFARLGHGTLRPISDPDWQALDVFVADYDRMIQESIEE